MMNREGETGRCLCLGVMAAVDKANVLPLGALQAFHEGSHVFSQMLAIGWKMETQQIQDEIHRRSCIYLCPALPIFLTRP